MVYKWEPWTQYNAGAVVEYDGSLWQIVQPHQSEPNWQPPNVPALWTRLPEEECGDYHSGNRHHGVEEQHRFQQPRPDQQPQPGGWGEHHNQHQQGQHNGWLTEKRKHELEIGGGIVGALAIGAGIYAYSKHESEEKEEAKRAAWRDGASGETWAAGAQARTDHYNRGGAAPPVRWQLVRRGEPIPSDALVGGHEHGTNLYFARVYVDGQLLVGKAGSHLLDGRGGASVAVEGREVNFEEYEILVGETHSVRWVNHHMQTGVLRVEGWQPVEGGRDRDGKFIFVTQMRHEGGVHPGRYVEDDRCAYFAWGGGMVEAFEFNVLAYK